MSFIILSEIKHLIIGKEKPIYTGLKDELIVKSSKLFYLFLLLIPTLSILASIYNDKVIEQYKEAPVGMWLINFLFLLVGIVALYELLTPVPRLVINHVGIWSRSNGLIRWDEIENKNIVEESDGEGIIYYLIIKPKSKKQKIKVNLSELNISVLDIKFFMAKTRQAESMKGKI